MGMNHRVYVGPYLRCTTKKKPQKITFWGCASDMCDLIHKKERLAPHIKFCPHCGGPCGDTEVDGPETDVVRADKLTYITDDRLAMYNSEYAKDGLHLFVPNQDWPRDFTPDTTATGEILANPDQDFVRHEITWLKVEFEKEIEAATKLYTETEGAEGTVEVCWGILGEFC